MTSASVVTVFQILTGEDWNAAMYSCMETYGDGAVIYFLSLTIIGTYVLLFVLGSVDFEDHGGFPSVDPLARILARYNRHFNPIEGAIVSGPIEQIHSRWPRSFSFSGSTAHSKEPEDIVNNPNF